MGVTRRSFLATLPAPLLAARELACDVAIIGGSMGGVAAALAALRNGMRVILTEETDWVGGQITSQAVPPDEHPWIEQFGGTASYHAYRRAVRDYYRHHFPLTAEARARWNLNPGDGSVSRITHEPRVSLAVLETMLAPYLGGGRLVVLLNHRPLRADVTGDRVRAVTTRNLVTGLERTITAPYFLDGTEQGDLLPLTKTEYVMGFESRKETGELHAPEQAQPANIQAFTVCFAVDHLPGQDHVIDKPEEYAFWRDYVPAMKPAWPGKLLSWHMSDPQKLTVRNVHLDPTLTPGQQGLNLFLYRRIANRGNFAPGSYVSDITLVNWP
ncbi:MAG: FAD-dependent oxidoreductase, partial [Bryobacterales bacterium]|nr:FAD-dependent oxidoreductase [Bryobacterales bacterium]